MAFLRDRSVFCIPGTILPSEERYIIGGICMATSSFGFIGAALQLKSLWQYRDRQRRRPSPNPNIIFYLALSDLIACVGVFALAICLMTMDKPQYLPLENIHKPKHNDLYAPLGTTIEVITLFAYLATYIWTFAYALDMCFQIYQTECPMIVYHILAWLIPIELVAIIEAVNFGKYPNVCELYYGRISRLILSYFPVMAVMFANPILFLVTYKRVKYQLRSSGRYTNADRDALNLCKRKFLWMVVVFTVCWLPNIVTVTYDLVTLHPRSDQKSKLGRLWFVEAFVNPLQGIFNYFVYRRSFKVTATDTRPGQNSLPRVSRTSWLERFHSDGPLSESSTYRTIQRMTDSSRTHDESSPLLSTLQTPRETDVRPYTYVSRLLGE